MNQKTLVAAVLFVAIGGLAFWLLRSPDRGERVGKKPRPIPPLNSKQVAKVTITSKGKNVTLARKGQSWRIEAPLSYAADKYAADTMDKKLEELAFGDLVSEQPTRHAEFGVDDQKGTRVQLFDAAGKSLADFTLGKVIDGFTMFRLAGDKKVWQAAGSLRPVFDKDLKLWRDRSIVKITQNKVRELELATAAGTAKLARKDAKAPWTLVSAPIELPKLDKAAISQAVSTLSSLSAQDFADGIKPKAAGLEPPVATITATLEDKTSLRLEVGNELKDARYVRVAGKPQVFKATAYAIKALLLRPIDLKDKTIVALDAAKVTALTLTKHSGDKAEAVKLVKKGKTWLGNGKKVASTTKLEKGLKTLSALKAQGFAKLPESALGLDKPAWQVVVEFDGGKRFELTIGSVEKDQARAVRLTGNKDLFMVRRYVLDQFLLDPKNYK